MIDIANILLNLGSVRLNLEIMKKSSYLVFKAVGVLGVFLLVIACAKKDDGYMCTMEFRAVQIKVVGDELNDAYTIRTGTNDTLRFDHQAVNLEENYYTVLDDSYQVQLQDKTEQFRFIGILNDEVVVNELFIISADKCHVNYISGNLEVEIE